MMRIGVPLLQGQINSRHGWIAGFYFVRTCLNAMAHLPAETVPEVTVLVPASFNEELIFSEFAEATPWLQVVNVPDELLQVHSDQRELQHFLDPYPFDLLFPLLVAPVAHFRSRAIGWIPDYQHKHHPAFFSDEEIYDRDVLFDFLIGFCDRIVCISTSVLEDLDRFYSHGRGKGVLLPFPAVLPRSVLAHSPCPTLQRLGIDQRYIYLPNQFWVHKNHKLVFEAWSILKKAGQDILLVCTGAPRDYRHPHYYRKLNEYVSEHELHHSIKLLGFISRDDQIQLFRGATAVLQPSLFEGWNTSIEEARTLGKRLIVSDIAVHREQVGSSAIYFDKNSAENLASVVQQMWQESSAGHEPEAERAAFVQAEARAREFGRALIDLFKDVPACLDDDDAKDKNRMLPLIVGAERLRAKVGVLEAENAARLELINARGGEIVALHARARSLEVESAALNARVHSLEFESAARLDLINQRGDEIADLQMQLENIHQDGFHWLLTTSTRPPSSFRFEYPACDDLVSVVIPAYNAANFLERCVRSVWGQRLSGARLEIMLCDDGSTDGSYELAIALQSQSPVPFQVLTHPGRANKGVSSSRNLGLHHARGAYIALLDADDAWLPHRLAVQVNYLDQHPDVQCVCSHGYNRDPQGNLVKGWNGTVIAGDYRNAPPPDDFRPPYTFDQLLKGDPVVNSTLLIRRNAIAAAGGYPQTMAHQAEDWLLLAKLSLQTPIALIEQELIDYTVHSGSYTTRYFVEGLAYGVKVEFLYHLVHWMVLHPEYHDLGIEVFRHHYPRLIAARRGAYRLIEDYYQHKNQTAAGIAEFEAHLHSIYSELQELRLYRDRMERRLQAFKRIPGFHSAFSTLKKLRVVPR